MVVDTQDRGGALLKKRFRVQTNDPQNSRVVLTVIGQVQGYAKLSNKFIRLAGPQGANLESRVTIVPQSAYPFKIKKVEAQKGEHISFDLKPLGIRPAQHGYELIVRNIKTTPGNYRDLILLQTDLQEKPVFQIPVSGRILGRKGNAQQKSK